MHTVILGAGVCGLTAAYGLSQISGETYSIYEQQARSGGYCQSPRQGGFTFDIVSHVLHFRSDEAKELVHKLLDGDLLYCKRSAWIYFRNRYIPHPFQINLGFLPLPERAACLAGYWRAWLNRKLDAASPPENLQEWIQFYLGAGIARHFMTPYNTKLWGCPPEEMSVDWMRPFVPEAPGWDMVASLVSNRVSHVGRSRFFYYPTHGGIQTLVDSLEARIAPAHLNHQVMGINLDRKTVRFQNGREVSYDRLISTIPLKTLARQAVGLPEELRRDAEQLRCTSLLSLTYCISRPLPHSIHWLYFPEPEYPFFRIVFPSNHCSSLAPKNSSIISVEISEPDANRLDELDQATQQHLIQLGFIQGVADIQFRERYYFDHAYPVHDLGREARVSRLNHFLQSRDVWSIGRFGGWRYSIIEDAMVEALQAAREAAESVAARRLTRAAGAGAS